MAEPPPAADRSLAEDPRVVKYAAIGPVAVHLPATVETNDDLQARFPDWDMGLIAQKTGIHTRHVAAPDETASDLAVSACRRLFEEFDVDPASVDFLILCTQAPDYPLPTTACLMQDRLGLPTRVGAFDVNLGCSAYPYGLALADGLIRTGVARRVLLVTAETYSKYIDPADRSLRTIFGDAAAATLIEAADVPSLTAFQFGTDGAGADTLIVGRGGARTPERAIKPRHRQRWASALYMDGPSLIDFTVAAVPDLIANILAAGDRTLEEIDLVLFHQATRKMLEQLAARLGLTEARMPIMLADVGNTVSSTLPIVIDRLRRDGRLTPEHHHLLVGFGVGWSWGGCIWRDVWQAGGVRR